MDAGAVIMILEFIGKKDTVETFSEKSIVERLAHESFLEKLYGRA